MPPEDFGSNVVRAEFASQPQEDAFEEALKEKGVTILESGEHWSGAVDLATFEPLLSFPDLKRLQKATRDCAQYLSFPFITDTIQEHKGGADSRRTWRANMIEQYKDRARFLAEHRIRKNMLFFHSNLSILRNALKDASSDSPFVMGLKERAEAALALIEPREKFDKLYDLLPTEDPGTEEDEVRNKVALIKELSERIRDFLRYAEHPQAA